MQKNVKCQVLDSKSDFQGRYLFLKIKNGIKVYTIANVYFPNTSQVSEGLKYIRILETFAEGDIILGCDFNLVFDPRMDSSSEKKHISYSALRK